MMNAVLKNINSFLYNEFVFSTRYRVWRHVFYWTLHSILWAVFWVIMGSPLSFFRNLFNMSLLIPLFLCFGYPLLYIAVPHLLLKGKVWQFFVFVLLWGIAGLYINAGYRTYLYVPLQEWIGFSYIDGKGFQANSYLCMTTSVASPMIIRFFKLWTIKQKAWVQAKKEQISTELQLLKAQVQPNFFFSSLDSIHSSSVRRSPKTPGLILKLSSLLSYMLYDCKTEEVLMEKEVEVIKNYIDLEKERLGNRIDISLNIEGDIQDRYITPLLILPFLENAFKHGTAAEIEHPWMSVDIAVKDYLLQYKVVNSKNEWVTFQQNGPGIGNVKKRLEILYPGKHGLKLVDQGDFFVVSLWINLNGGSDLVTKSTLSKSDLNIYSYEIAMPAGR